MKVLLLGPERRNIIDFFKSRGDEVVTCEKRIKVDSDILNGVDFVVSYGYRYIIKDDVLDLFPGRIINLHISLLPWNRGSDPNLWSFLEDTPKGVTIHQIDKGLDTGKILAQREVTFEADDTLSTSYEKLSNTIEHLLFEILPDVCSGSIQGTKQETGGSYHRSKDKTEYEHLLHSGWDTPVADLTGAALEKA